MSNLDADSDLGIFKKYESSTSIERKSLKRFLEVEIWRSGASPEMKTLYPMLTGIEKACRDISLLMRRISTDNLEGLSQGSTINVQGENQKKLDVLANSIIKNAVCGSGVAKAVASEEEEEVCLCSSIMDSINFDGDYVVLFDPLDGSSNIDSGLPTGTIFGIHRKPKYSIEKDQPNFLDTILRQRGRELVAAGYCLYSSSTHMVITMRSGVHMFTLDDVSGEFYLTKSNIRIPVIGSLYAFNDANFNSWPTAIRNYIHDKRDRRVEGLKARYFGALVADVHNILLNGGIFGYPGTKNQPNGKLRLAYEANPLALILEESGGKASNGIENILELPVLNIHQRTPLYIGSARDVESLEKYIQFYTSND